MVSRTTLERLLSGQEAASPQGKRSQGNESTGKSSPTGWSQRKGSVNGQELRFPNGYTVLALQIEGQKSVIKGPQAWLGLIQAIERGEVSEVVNEWLNRMADNMVPKAETAKEPAAQNRLEPKRPNGGEVLQNRRQGDSRVDKLEKKMESLSQAIDGLIEAVQAKRESDDARDAE